MSASLRYGVLGTGMMGVEHINNLLHLPGATVTAISDPNERSRDWARLAVGLDVQLQHFESHHELLEHDGLMSVALGVAAHRSTDEGRPIMIQEILAR